MVSGRFFITSSGFDNHGFFDISSETPWLAQTASGEETLFGFLYRREFGAFPEKTPQQED